MKKPKDKYKELGGEFKNDAALDEELDEEGADKDKAEEEHFEETEEDDWE
ncbi:MAG: hypothetical protein PHH54_06580 [Candidatus Nanoarchaeia archaeon]|nr:hypothetical protein [Candidatus Nanoarchaeia archaeon]MDD5741622.1 hypothetical protein [Candidatus Nanoarchaeia archaeon]